jgi:hypothetical protein
MEHEAVKAMKRFDRLETFGKHHFEFGVKTNNAARIVRAVRFIEAVHARPRPSKSKATIGH